MIKAALSIVFWFISLFASSKEDKERAAGEQLGKAETERDNAESGLSEVQRAIDSQPAPTSGVRDGSDPAAGSYRGGPD